MISTDSASHRVLTRGQMDEIHDASMKVLEQTGLRVDSSEATALLEDAGAYVSGDGRVRIPAHLIEWAVGAAPSNVTIYDRTGREAMQLGRRRTYFGTGSDTPNVVDPRTDERRRAVLADVADFARVCDALPNIDFIMCMGIASDVDRSIAELHHALAMLRNTTKPFVFTALDLTAAQKLVAMFELVAGGPGALRERPFALMYNEPVSPLGFARDNMDKLLFAAERGVPSVFMSGLLCGGTSPVTPAGGLVLGNVESLAGVLIAQLKRKGTPVVAGGGVLGMDMRTMAPSYSTPEFMLTMAAIGEMAQYYGLPAWGYAGCSDAKTFDAQAAADAAEWVLMAALSGSNLVHDVGFIESGLTSSFDELVFTDEAIGKCARLVGGIATDEEALATKAIADVGPGGHFLGHRHTSKHFRENWPCELEDRMNHGSWVAAGSQTMEQRVRAKVLDLLETHEPPALPADVDAELVRMVEDASVTRPTSPGEPEPCDPGPSSGRSGLRAIGPGAIRAGGLKRTPRAADDRGTMPVFGRSLRPGSGRCHPTTTFCWPCTSSRPPCWWPCSSWRW